eukprot:CAMPEP_0115345440 /NCGR_PEP_ID=MMETSP0270-20121206/93820_1 /TAXON_ID=71861 /ORGANISM="Scrippsiella trochoidea, Strain CCMP3099" /LENGTH=58 /DNA_ID=CAMNT_0002767239 /DNA_START=47 /DNA_END=223 /DNA_ORIENTATION=-
MNTAAMKFMTAKYFKLRSQARGTNNKTMAGNSVFCSSRNVHFDKTSTTSRKLAEMKMM